MRAARQAHSKSIVEHGETSRLWTGVVVALVALGVLLLVWRPSIVHAQDSTAASRQPSVPRAASVASAPQGATATHVVKVGETLWSIAARYYGDGHEWTTLARNNRIPTNGERALEVGMKLTVPARPAVRGPKSAVVAAAPADSTVPKVALAKAGEGTLPFPPKPGTLAAQTAAKGNAVATSRQAVRPAAGRQDVAKSPAPTAPAVDTAAVDPSPQRGALIGIRRTRRIGLVDLGDQIASRKPNEVETVFHRDLPDAAEAERRTQAVLRPNTPAPRRAEVEAAPFVVTETELAKAGRVDQRIGSRMDFAPEYPQRAIKTDEVTLKAPTGVTYKVGDRLVAINTQSLPTQKGATRIAVPTGVLVVTKAEPGRPALAALARQSGRVEQGQRVVAAPTASGEWVRAVSLSTPDLSTTVHWLDVADLLPTLQSFLLLGGGTSQGFQPGDEVAIYRRAEGAASESLAAIARVVRVDRETSAAVITRQYASDIAVGQTARRFAKAP
ncbi:MAG: LysM peptidoglycan-binding domain-containing protein [Gemmatimonadaceae bacterium]